MEFEASSIKARLHVPSKSPFFCNVLKWVQCSPIVLFTHNVKKIKGAINKNSYIDDTCKQTHTFYTLIFPYLTEITSLTILEIGDNETVALLLNFKN